MSNDARAREFISWHHCEGSSTTPIAVLKGGEVVDDSSGTLAVRVLSLDVLDLEALHNSIHVNDDE